MHWKRNALAHVAPKQWPAVVAMLKTMFAQDSAKAARAHWPQIASANPLERLNGEIKRRSDVIGIFPNDRAVLRLVGALMLEQTDVYGPPPPCKGFQTMTTAPVLAVVYPASSRGNTAAGPDDFRGSAARQMDELMTARIVQGPLPNPVRPVRHHHMVPTQASAARRRRRPCHAAAATTAGRR